jgi:hypothetical protein
MTGYTLRRRTPAVFWLDLRTPCYRDLNTSHLGVRTTNKTICHRALPAGFDLPLVK